VFPGRHVYDRMLAMNPEVENHSQSAREYATRPGEATHSAYHPALFQVRSVPLCDFVSVRHNLGGGWRTGIAWWECVLYMPCCLVSDG
jgi:hypothetical protein